MKKIMLLITAVCLIFVLSACGSKADRSEKETENTSDDFSVSANTEETSGNTSSLGSLSLEDVTTEYVEPPFKVAKTLAECYNYFDDEPEDNVKKETNSDGKITAITVTDDNGNTKSDLKIQYGDELMVTVSYYTDGEVTEKVVFLFYDENSLNVAAHSNSESSISLYMYNKDGSFKSYIDGDGFSSLLLGAVMDGLGGALSQ